MISAQQRPSSQSAPVSADPKLSEKDFQEIAGMISEEAGIQFPDSKRLLVEARVARRLRSLNLPTYAAYISFMASKDGGDERQQLIAALTTNVTRFFREPHHFDDLKARVLPELIKRAQNGGRVRIWSTACSSGEEPYSIAMTALAMAPGLVNTNFKILATDLDHNILAQAKAGLYSQASANSVPEPLRKKFFRDAVSNGRAMQSVTEEPRALITFNRLNLVKPLKLRGPFDVIFCRNVVIYFNDETSAKIWSGFEKLLANDGNLYIGHSERVRGPAGKILTPTGITTYQKTNFVSSQNGGKKCP